MCVGVCVREGRILISVSHNYPIVIYLTHVYVLYMYTYCTCIRTVHAFINPRCVGGHGL